MSAADSRERITVGIGSLGRAGAVIRCLESLERIQEIIEDVIVVDDGSTPPLEAQIRAAPLPVGIRQRLSLLRHDQTLGVAAARNLIAERANTALVLNLDDDAVLLEPAAIHAALDVLRRDERVGAVAFAAADSVDAVAEAPAATDPRYVASFVGFAHLLRRGLFLSLGGFRPVLEINGEEREYSLRLLESGAAIVELPNALVAHVRVPGTWNAQRYLFLTVRNGVLAAAYNLPFPLNVLVGMRRLIGYFPHRRGWKIDDPGGFARILRGLRREIPTAFATRRPVRWQTLRRWRTLVRERPPYIPPA